MAVIGMAYMLLALREVWRGRGDGVWRWPIMLLLLVHTAAIPIHIPLAGPKPNPLDVDLRTFAIFEVVFVCICGAYLLGGLAKDRLTARYRHASLTDPLTGVPNRRGFFEIGNRLLDRTRYERRPAALLVFDLDQFKNINDRYGHIIGDEVLTEFCQLATSSRRPSDLFGRIGGEEFASLLPATGAEDACRLAERLRTAFEGTSHAVGGRAVTATVSAGIAVSDDASIDLETLLKAADRALYLAKARGRNRVEIAERPAELQPTKPRRIPSPAVVSRVFRTLIGAERRPRLAQAVMAPLICWSFSSSIFK
jgi:diguanylate cyclase (GGDEF)-like protein